MLIVNGTIITWETPNRILEGQAILIRDGVIREIANQDQLLRIYPAEEHLDARGQLVVPGNICAHTHFYGAFARGMAIPGRLPADFPEILKKLWWPLDRALTPEDIYYSTLVCLVEAIKYGTTTLFDHHASPNAISGSLNQIARAIDEAGLRASLCYEITDRGGEKQAKAGLEENLRFIEYVRNNRPSQGRLAAMCGLHAGLTLSESTLQACRSMVPDDVGFHVHVAEHVADQYDSLEKTGQRVVERLYEHGILGPKTIVVHAVHVDAYEIRLLAEAKTWVTHQPRSNMNNAVGMADVESMLHSGIRVCIGNDGFLNAMWEEWKATYLAHKLWNSDPRRMPGDRVIQMAIYHNGSLASEFFGAPIGKLIPGAHADILFVDYHPYTPLTVDNLPWHILFGFHESMVTMTMVAGRILMNDRKLLTLDEEKIASHARGLASAVWQRYKNQF